MPDNASVPRGTMFIGLLSILIFSVLFAGWMRFDYSRV
jgi:hypothetical protein